MLLFASLPIFKKFTITNTGTGKTVYIRDLGKTNEFFISFIHSVNRTPVEEYYRISGDNFIVYKTVFESYGAGMPEDMGIELKNGKIAISDIYNELSEFSVFIGTIASHEIVFEDESFHLSELSPPQSLIKFKVRGVSAGEMLLYKLGW